MRKIIYRFKVSALIAILPVFFYSCEDRSDLTAPQPPSTGSANFTSFVSLGNSFTAAFQNNSLYEGSQKYSFGKIIADQVGTSYAQPTISEPGLPGKLELRSLSPVLSILPNSGMGQPNNTNYVKPYNNLGIPAAILYDLVDTTDFATKSVQRNNPYFQIVLRNPALGNSPLMQALNLAPTFVTLWIGQNDVLGYATSGGTMGTDPTGKLPTDALTFAFLYNQVAAALKASGANVVVANLIDLKVFPFFTTVGPSVGQALQTAMAANPQVQGLFYQKNGEFVATGLAQPNDLLTNALYITLVSSPYASLIGNPSGKFYRDNGITTLPPGIDTTQAFGLHPQNPWPDAFILDADEQAVANNAIASFNASINSVAGANGFPVVDFNTLFRGFLTPVTIDGVEFSSSFILGGLFSLDGIHPTTQGYGFAANAFINTINATYNAQIPTKNLSTLPGSIPVP